MNIHLVDNSINPVVVVVVRHHFRHGHKVFDLQTNKVRVNILIFFTKMCVNRIVFQHFLLKRMS